MMVRASKAMFLILFMTMGITTWTWAHKVNIFAWPEGDVIHSESKFSGGRPASDTTVEVYEYPGDELLLTGSTDGEGRFSFPLPQVVKDRKSGIKVVLKASMGHLDEWIIPPVELGFSSQDVNTPEDFAHSVTKGDSGPSLLTRAEFQTIIEHVLDRKLAPIREQLAAQQKQGPDMMTILSGLGYILGILGIVLFIQSRKRRPR